jgi:cell wall-associated NlpC family hydrolase
MGRVVAEGSTLRTVRSLSAIGIATLVALAGIGVAPHPVTATDPSDTPAPTPSPTSISAPEPSPSATPAPEPRPTPVPEPSVPADPAPSASTEPAPSIEPASTAEPAPSIEPAPTAEPVATPAPVTATDTAPTKAELLRERYLRAARVAVRQRHDRYVAGGTGPDAFDCSGLVRYAYRQAGISGRLGGGHSARAMLEWARRHDKTRKRNPRIGDVVIWGNGRHAGIWIGNGRVISALNPRQGIRITGLHDLGDRFTAFIRTQP